MWPEVDLKYFRHQKNIFGGSRKSIVGPKRPISVSCGLNWTIWGLFRRGKSLDGPFFCSLPWEMYLKAALKDFRHHKIVYFGAEISYLDLSHKEHKQKSSIMVKMLFWGLNCYLTCVHVLQCQITLFQKSWILWFKPIWRGDGILSCFEAKLCKMRPKAPPNKWK